MRKAIVVIMAAVMAMAGCGNVDKTAEAKTEKAVSGDPELTFTVNDKDYSLPCTFGELEAFHASKKGWRNRMDSTYYSVGLTYEDYEYQVGTAECLAPDAGDEDMVDNQVTELTLSISDMHNAVISGEKLSFEYMGLGIDMTVDDVIKKLGKPEREEDGSASFRSGSTDILVTFHAKTRGVEHIVFYTKDSFLQKNTYNDLQEER